MASQSGGVTESPQEPEWMVWTVLSLCGAGGLGVIFLIIRIALGLLGKW